MRANTQVRYANIEILERVGEENIFIFGLTAAEVRDRHHKGYQPGQIIEENELLSRVLREISKGTFSGGDTERFKPLLDNLYHHDNFMITADFESYMERQQDVGATYRDYHRWFRSAILNTSNVGWFSSDRTIREYDRDIWHSKPSLHTQN